MRSRWTFLVPAGALALSLLPPSPAGANGVLRDGYGAESMGMGGTSTAFSRDPLSAVSGNPATLTLLDRPMFSFSLTGIHGDGDFDNAFNSHAGLGRDTGAFPELAIAYPVPNSRFTLGFALTVDSARLADWHYFDAPGGIDGATTYGQRTHRAEFLALSATVAVGVKFSDKLSLGLAAGAVYHRVGLDVPFIFQSEPALAGWKTLLDLDTDGYGWRATFGALYRPSENLSLGLSYLTKTDLHSYGRAKGDVSAQLDSLGLAGTPSRFRYDAEVDTALPQMISGGLSWQCHERLRLAAQVDWIGWGDAFDELRVSLDEGTNSAINGVTGGDNLRDVVPVDWKDRFVYRAGLEWDLHPEVSLLLGYSYGRSPVPANLTTPLNGSIFEHTLTAGLRATHGPWHTALAYQYHLPNAESVGQSRYLSGEYDQSTLRVSAHLLALSLGYSF